MSVLGPDYSKLSDLETCSACCDVIMIGSPHWVQAPHNELSGPLVYRVTELLNYRFSGAGLPEAMSCGGTRKSLPVYGHFTSMPTGRPVTSTS